MHGAHIIEMEPGLVYNLKIRGHSFSRLGRFAVRLASIFAFSLVSNACAEDVLAESGSEKISRVRVDREFEAKERTVAISVLKQKLANAKTPEEKRAVIEEFRAENEGLLEARLEANPEKKTPSVRMAELKARAQDNPEMLARIDAMEARLASVEMIKAKLAEAQTATGEQKVRLQEDIRRKQTKLMQLQQQAAQSRLGEASARNAEATKLPPEMAAMKAKSEARRQELDQLREALTKASPQERQKLLDAWREKRMQETSARTIPSAQ